MNVYVLQTALQLAKRGVEVEVFTRATSSSDAPVVPVAPGVLVRNVVAGPFEGLDKYDLPTQLCVFAAAPPSRSISRRYFTIRAIPLVRRITNGSVLRGTMI
ncbi:hypothetical protein BHQ19_13930 [Mycolicibacterium porcinum]|nr:hypothetical protein BHQ19_13930 [Mycolicibacterium porcinum]